LLINKKKYDKDMKHYLFTLIIFVFINNIYSQEETDSIPETPTDQIATFFNHFQDLHVSYYGNTQNCVSYNVYAYKYRKFWFLIIKRDEQISIMIANPPLKNKEIDTPDQYLLEGIARSEFHKYTKLKKRKKSVLDMQLYGYYKFNRFGRKVAKGLLLLQYPYYYKGFLSNRLDPEKAAEEAAKAAEKAAKDGFKLFGKKKKIEAAQPAIDEVLTPPQ